MWIITEEVNDYNQHGRYFYCAFPLRPNKKDLKRVFPNRDEKFIQNLIDGGGRMGREGHWYFLNKVEPGEQLKYD